MEIFDICDENGVPTGKTVERTVAHREGIRHRTAHIWVVRRVNGVLQVLLQKRSANKESWPGALDTSSAGHIQAGDEPLESALRELSEELGIFAKPEELTYAGRFAIQGGGTFHGSPFIDNEVSFVYYYDRPVDISTLKLQEEEVESVVWEDYDRVVQARREGDTRYCATESTLRTLGQALGAWKEEKAGQ